MWVRPVLPLRAASAGDVNADGFSDVVVAAPFWSNGQASEGRAFLYLGSQHRSLDQRMHGRPSRTRWVLSLARRCPAPAM